MHKFGPTEVPNLCRLSGAMEKLQDEFTALLILSDDSHITIDTLDALNAILRHFGHAPLLSLEELEDGSRYYWQDIHDFYDRFVDELNAHPRPLECFAATLNSKAASPYPLVRVCQNCGGRGLDTGLRAESEDSRLCEACDGRGGFSEEAGK